MRAVREGGNISLFCGNQILSNPQAVVTWLDPMLNKVLGDGTNIVNSNNGSRINLYAATESENGTWTCNVMVAGINVTNPETLEILPIVQIGAEQFEIELIVVGKGIKQCVMIIKSTVADNVDNYSTVHA